MTTFIALFRGINVGGHNILPMKELRDTLEESGLKNVKTYIQSGNVVFQSKANDSEKLARKIGLAVKKSHGLTPEIQVLGAGALQEAIAANPYPEGEEDPKSRHLFFLKSAPINPNLEKLASLRAATERFELKNNIFYLHAPDGIARSKLASKVEKELGVGVTARNWRSAQKILSLALELEKS